MYVCLCVGVTIEARMTMARIAYRELRSRKRGEAMRSSVRKKITTGSSNTRATPRITFTNRSKYSLTETIGVMLISRPMPSRNSKP